MAAFCARTGSNSSSFATQAHMEAETAKLPEAAQPSMEPGTRRDDSIPTSSSSSSSTAAPDVAEDVFHFVPQAQRRQKPLPTTDSVFLWARSEEQARLKQLIKMRAGKGGMTRKFLATCGDLLAAHEIVRVSVAESSGLEASFVQHVLEGCLDCVCVKKKGRTLTMFRESGLPRPITSFRDELGILQQYSKQQQQQQAITGSTPSLMDTAVPVSPSIMKAFRRLPPHKQKYNSNRI
ncbi:MAG: hypothetical protein WDW38_005490 [Sanguina aurantia]